MQAFPSHYIAGHWVVAQSPESFKVHDSNTEEVMATVPAGTAEEAAKAVQAARGAFEGWSRLSAETRAGYLDKVSSGLKARMDEVATIIAREVGMPLKLARSVQVGGPVWNWANFAKVVRLFEWEERVRSLRRWAPAARSCSSHRAISVARRMRTGQVDINGAPFNGNAPFGGYKQSGIGRENGKYGIAEFLEYKSIQFKPA